MNSTPRLTAIAPIALLTLAALGAAPAFAQKIKPGLWDMTSKVQSDNPAMAKAMAEMQKSLAAMPPDQRKAMEDMMAKNGGVKFNAGGDGSVTLKMCLTQEMINDSMYAVPQGNCTHSKSPMVGNTMSFTYSCTNPPSKGEGTMKYLSDTSYTSKMKAVNMVNGKNETMTAEGSGKWLSSDCGAVKPITAPKTK